MTFDPNASLDPGQITDRRGMGGRGVAIGGGGAIGIVLLLAYTLLGGNPNDLGPLLEPGAVTGPGSSQLATDCKTGADANARDDCRVLGYVNSVQAYWKAEFQAVQRDVPAGQHDPLLGRRPRAAAARPAPRQGRSTARPMSWSTSTPTSSRSFATRFGATGGSLAQGYVIAHEYGHHVQDLLGILRSGGSSSGAEGDSVRTELQADCFAGVWANHAASTKFLEPLTDAQIADALDAASAVGDDRIQAATSGQVNPDSWTHGSSAQRQKWFTTGYSKGDPSACDTFNGDI